MAIKKPLKKRLRPREEDTEDGDVAVDERPVKKKKAGADTAAIDARQAELLSLVDELDNKAKVASISFGNERRMHSGLLCMDLMLGGGIAPAMTTFLGPEQSAKTTLAITIMAASVDQRVDMRVHWDAEGSTSSSIDYVANIFDTVGVKKATTDTVFGVRGSKGWSVPPMVFIKDDYEGQKFFDWFHGLQKRLPDKRYEDGKWWYVYDDAKDVMKVKAHLAKLGLTIDKAMTAKNPGIWVQAEDSRLQAIVLIDSWVSLVPPSMDEEEGDNSLAVQARFFSKQLPRIKGALRAKRIALLGINQLRLNPMQRYGSPETEPGGQALRFWSDQRFRLFPNALSSAPYNPKSDPNMKDGRFETEPSVTGRGNDTYRYISVKTIKNKLSIPTASTWLRLWVSDGDGNARGYDPVFDLFHYLIQTGQASGKRSAVKLHIDGLDPATKALTWLDFKKLVLGTKEEKTDIFKRIGMHPVDLRKGCVNQLRVGRGKELFIQQVQEAASRKKTDDDDAGDE